MHECSASGLEGEQHERRRLLSLWFGWIYGRVCRANYASDRRLDGCNPCLFGCANDPSNYARLVGGLVATIHIIGTSVKSDVYLVYDMVNAGFCDSGIRYQLDTINYSLYTCPMNDEFLSIPQVAAHLGLSRITVYQMVKAGSFPAMKVGRSYIIRRADLEAWLAANNPPKPRRRSKKTP